MSPPGRPKGEYRRAQPEGTQVSRLLRVADETSHPPFPRQAGGSGLVRMKTEIWR